MTQNPKNNGTITDIKSYDGKVQVTINGETKTYLGSKGHTGAQGEIIIDGSPVKLFDNRLVPNNSFSIFSPKEKLEMISKAEEKGFNLEMDSMGNMSFSKR